MYPALVAGYTRLMTENESQKIRAAQERWTREVAAQARARAAEVARNPWSRSYPGSD
jgi:hypothetical protein